MKTFVIIFASLLATVLGIPRPHPGLLKTAAVIELQTTKAPETPATEETIAAADAPFRRSPESHRDALGFVFQNEGGFYSYTNSEGQLVRQYYADLMPEESAAPAPAEESQSPAIDDMQSLTPPEPLEEAENSETSKYRR